MLPVKEIISEEGEESIMSLYCSQYSEVIKLLA